MASLIDGRTTPLTFTFVPAVGTLPSQVLVGKDSVYLPKILIGHKEEMAQKNTEESERILDKNTDENSRSFSVTRHKWNSERDFAKEEPASHSVKEIKHNDLFIAEFVAVMDSDDGEDELSKKQNQSIKPFEEKGCDFRGIQQSTRAKPNADIARANENKMHFSKADDFSYDVSDQELPSYKIKSNYKAFAAIPTNTLLRDQKAIDEAAITRDNTTCEEDMDTHSEMCSPALLRQQTEEICAAIDEVLHDDPLPMNYKPASKPTTKKDLKTGNVTKTPPKTAGRETKYASIRHFTGARASNLQTKPGVIRPMSLKISTEEITDGHYSPFNFQKYSMPQYRRDTDYAERTQRREMSSDR
ncbi:muscular LMNA-interacting protein isoform X2 [Hyperolius riggenbachi]|uniref:muscular LMNA-interacting protein isoform X2 n=1 Tax=Hyperolius riggenbachi TaxID=752182 RepID=UPI0035A2C156